MNTEEVIKEVKNIEKFNYTLAPKEVFDKIYLALECYQSIEEPKTGHWVEVNSYESEHHSVTDMRCNICGKYSSVVLPHKTRFTYPYCPNYGAKMEEQ